MRVKAKPTACSLLSTWTQSMWEFNGSHARISHNVLERNVWSSNCAICNYLLTCGSVADFVFLLTMAGLVELGKTAQMHSMARRQTNPLLQMSPVALHFYFCHLNINRVNSGHFNGKKCPTQPEFKHRTFQNFLLPL